MINWLSRWKGAALVVSVCICCFSGSALADQRAEIEELKRRIAELEKRQEAEISTLSKKTDTIADEVQRTKLSATIPEKAELKSQYGMGPAASSVYQVDKGVSIGAYGEANFRNFTADAGEKKDQTDFLRLVGYLGYKFNDSIIFNSEIEFEHGTTDDIGGDSGEDEGEVSVEFAYMDFLFEKEINARVGMVLIPMGFVNEMHEPPFFHGVRRPEVENIIIPSTWRENGVGLFGEGEAAGKIEYRTYLVNGLRAKRFTDSGIRDGRQKGNRALFEDIAWTGRLDYSPDFAPGLLVGGSFWLGNSGQDEEFAGEKPDVFTSIYEAHAQYHNSGLELRALGAWGNIDDADLLSEASGKSISEEFSGWYVEAAYDILPLLVSGTNQYLAPYFRYEAYDTQENVPTGFTRNASLDKTLYTYGISYKPISDVVLKFDYRNFETDGDKETADEVAFGIGFVF